MKIDFLLIMKIIRRISIKIDDILGNPFVFNYQKSFFKLLSVMIIPVFIVIRGSTAPLLSDSRLLFFLFYSDPGGDKTIYNIGISIIAAFIFYFFQVYIPESKRAKRYVYSFSDEHRQEIFLLNQYTLAWKMFLSKKTGECHFFEFSYTLKDDGDYSLNKRMYDETIDELPLVLERIIKNPLYKECDIAYQRFIGKSYYTVLSHLKHVDKLILFWGGTALPEKEYERIQKKIIYDLIKIQRRLSSIEKYSLEVIKISNYNGQSETQKLADLL